MIDDLRANGRVLLFVDFKKVDDKVVSVTKRTLTSIGKRPADIPQ